MTASRNTVPSKGKSSGHRGTASGLHRESVSQPASSATSYQSRIRQCLETKGLKKAFRKLDYQSCVTECMQQALEYIAPLYRNYPEPSPEVWSKCVSQSVALLGREANASSCMGRYEIVLAKLGNRDSRRCQGESAS